MKNYLGATPILSPSLKLAVVDLEGDQLGRVVIIASAIFPAQAHVPEVGLANQMQHFWIQNKTMW